MTSALNNRFTAVPFTKVRVDDAFWAPRMAVNRERTIPHQYRMCLETGRIGAYALDWRPGMEPAPHVFWDSDVAKWIEAAAYSLATHPDPALDALLDATIARIASAQQPDGYLNPHFTVVEPDKRWTNLRDLHELYCAGHLIEAAAAHFQATGKRALLDVMRRYADYIERVFGTGPGQMRGYCGHEEIELALVKLARATGEARYLALAQYFVDERGRQPYYFDAEAQARGENPATSYMGRYEYCQAHLPVREQREVVGHAVRAMYLYAAMADLAGETGDAALLAACEALWADLTLKKLYLTGGIGPSRHNEGFTGHYDLPNETAYAETCAAIGLVFWAHRMLQLDCDGRYADVMERALYNGALSGVSLDGTTFFYENPLASTGARHRQDWFGCACCPPNVARLLASLGGYIYGEREDALAVHLYVQSRVETGLAALRVETRYPWDGAVRITVDPRAARFTLRLRVPGWCREYRLAVNGAPLEAPVERGYLCLARDWAAGDTVTLELAMPVERLEAHPTVQADVGRVALQRGPLVYCLEAVDHEVDVRHIVLPEDAALTPRFDQALLGGVTVLEGRAAALDETAWAGTLYRPVQDPVCRPTPLRAIPYYAWDNREPGAMTVWVRR
ncbi:MAG TPA: glycoside hydrolase family 127 protein [Armatimonadota bacterium]|nr:glycoside hydrolase family 127 protein [Armatimonadota bacterium]